jgi:hypothetical protein
LDSCYLLINEFMMRLRYRNGKARCPAKVLVMTGT